MYIFFVLLLIGQLSHTMESNEKRNNNITKIIPATIPTLKQLCTDAVASHLTNKKLTPRKVAESLPSVLIESVEIALVPDTQKNILTNLENDLQKLQQRILILQKRIKEEQKPLKANPIPPLFTPQEIRSICGILPPSCQSLVLPDTDIVRVKHPLMKISSQEESLLKSLQQQYNAYNALLSNLFFKFNIKQLQYRQQLKYELNFCHKKIIKSARKIIESTRQNKYPYLRFIKYASHRHKPLSATTTKMAACLVGLSYFTLKP